MPDNIIKPDLNFINEIIANGGDSVKKCYQCAGCTAVCDITPKDKPFPRKEMIWAGWGLKDKLISNPDIWLCHQCNDCSAVCPRGAVPGQVMAAIRQYAIGHYAVPKIFRKLIGNPKFLPVLILIPVILISIALLLKTQLSLILRFALSRFDQIMNITHTAHNQGMEYANFFPHWLLIGFFSFFTGLSVLGMLISIRKFWNSMKNGFPVKKKNSLIKSIFITTKHILSHDKFSGCDTEPKRKKSHLMVFYGFTGLLILSAWGAIVIYILKWPFPFVFTDPAKIFGNICGLLLLFGSADMLINRFSQNPALSKNTHFDWSLLIIMLTVTITGFSTQFLRLADLKTIGYTSYFIHLVFVFGLIVYLPYTKFAHIVYRTTAMLYTELAGRDN